MHIPLLLLSSLRRALALLPARICPALAGTGKGYRLLLPAVMLLLLGCENSMDDIHKVGNQGKKLQVEEATEILSFMSKGGEMRARLTAPVMYNYHTDTPYIEFPRGIHVDLYKDSTLIRETIIDAKFCRYLVNEGRILMQDSVVVHNLISGDSLQTNEMWWNQREQYFQGSKPVVLFIAALQQNLRGSGFTAKQDLSKWSLTDSTVGDMMVPPEMGMP